MEELPREILLIVLGYLNPSSLCLLCQTNSFFRQITSEDVLWKKLYKQEWGNFADLTKTWKANFRDISGRFWFAIINLVATRVEDVIKAVSPTNMEMSDFCNKHGLKFTKFPDTLVVVSLFGQILTPLTGILWCWSSGVLGSNSPIFISPLPR